MNRQTVKWTVYILVGIALLAGIFSFFAGIDALAGWEDDWSADETKIVLLSIVCLLLISVVLLLTAQVIIALYRLDERAKSSD